MGICLSKRDHYHDHRLFFPQAEGHGEDKLSFYSGAAEESAQVLTENEELSRYKVLSDRKWGANLIEAGRAGRRIVGAPESKTSKQEELQERIYKVRALYGHALYRNEFYADFPVCSSLSGPRTLASISRGPGTVPELSHGEAAAIQILEVPPTEACAGTNPLEYSTSSGTPQRNQVGICGVGRERVPESTEKLSPGPPRNSGEELTYRYEKPCGQDCPEDGVMQSAGFSRSSNRVAHASHVLNAKGSCGRKKSNLHRGSKGDSSQLFSLDSAASEQRVGEIGIFRAEKYFNVEGDEDRDYDVKVERALSGCSKPSNVVDNNSLHHRNSAPASSDVNYDSKSALSGTRKIASDAVRSSYRSREPSSELHRHKATRRFATAFVGKWATCSGQTTVRSRKEVLGFTGRQAKPPCCSTKLGKPKRTSEKELPLSTSAKLANLFSFRRSGTEVFGGLSWTSRSPRGRERQLAIQAVQWNFHASPPPTNGSKDDCCSPSYTQPRVEESRTRPSSPQSGDAQIPHSPRRTIFSKGQSRRTRGDGQTSRLALESRSPGRDEVGLDRPHVVTGSGLRSESEHQSHVGDSVPRLSSVPEGMVSREDDYTLASSLREERRHSSMPRDARLDSRVSNPFREGSTKIPVLSSRGTPVVAENVRVLERRASPRKKDQKLEAVERGTFQTLNGGFFHGMSFAAEELRTFYDGVPRSQYALPMPAKNEEANDRLACTKISATLSQNASDVHGQQQQHLHVEGRHSLQQRSRAQKRHSFTFPNLGSLPASVIPVEEYHYSSSTSNNKSVAATSRSTSPSGPSTPRAGGSAFGSPFSVAGSSSAECRRKEELIKRLRLYSQGRCATERSGIEEESEADDEYSHRDQTPRGGSRQQRAWMDGYKDEHEDSDSSSDLFDLESLECSTDSKGRAEFPVFEGSSVDGWTQQDGPCVLHVGSVKTRLAGPSFLISPSYTPRFSVLLGDGEPSKKARRGDIQQRKGRSCSRNRSEGEDEDLQHKDLLISVALTRRLGLLE